jgi:hypothetical protein
MHGQCRAPYRSRAHHSTRTCNYFRLCASLEPTQACHERSRFCRCIGIRAYHHGTEHECCINRCALQRQFADYSRRSSQASTNRRGGISKRRVGQARARNFHVFARSQDSISGSSTSCMALPHLKGRGLSLRCVKPAAQSRTNDRYSAEAAFGLSQLRMAPWGRTETNPAGRSNGLLRSESLVHLARPLDLVALQVNRGRRN